jgi:uncharacterized protein
MAYLLDVNVLIALIDPSHVHHEPAHFWFSAEGTHAWATCPLTENAVLRILGQPRYPNSPGTPAMVAKILKALRDQSGHEFWGDNISIMESKYVSPQNLLSSTQITDTYLLALAVANGGQLVSFDRRLVTSAVHNGAKGLKLLG